MQIRHDEWNLPIGFIVGMSLSVVIAPENRGERIPDGISIQIFGKQFLLNDIWGKPEAVRAHICSVFGDPHLFTGHP
jgi:hypothetical protein